MPLTKTRIGQRAFEDMVFSRESGAKRGKVAAENVDSARIKRPQILFAGHNVQRSTTLGTGFRQPQRTVREVERGQAPPSRELRVRHLPVQSAGDHKVQQ